MKQKMSSNELKNITTFLNQCFSLLGENFLIWTPCENISSLSSIVLKLFDLSPGIVNSKSELIEPYFSTRKKTGGTGLGLSIVNKIITDHDGILELKNNSNNGLCVKITFNKLIWIKF